MTLPNEVWRGLFSQYRRLMLPTTEAPECYHYAVFATVFGVALGRSLCVVYVDPLHPNFYVCLVGRSGLPRKGTATARGSALLRHIDPKAEWVNVVPGLGSAEGLFDVLNGSRKIVLVAEEEFRSILAKGSQPGNMLIPKLTNLYDCRNRETLLTRSNPVEAKEPFVSLITGTTQAWLQKYFERGDVEGGFGNRFLYVIGEPSSPNPFPAKVDRDGLEMLAKEIIKVRSWAERQAVLQTSEEAKQTFAIYYLEQYERSKSDELTAVLSRRMPAYAWKLALLYAAQDNSAVIEKHHIEPALLAVEFFERSISPVFDGYGQSETKKLEDKIVSLLREASGYEMTTREIVRKLHISVAHLERIAGSLMKLGILEEIYYKPEDGRGGRISKGFKLVEREDS